MLRYIREAGRKPGIEVEESAGMSGPSDLSSSLRRSTTSECARDGDTLGGNVATAFNLSITSKPKMPEYFYNRFKVACKGFYSGR